MLEKYVRRSVAVGLLDLQFLGEAHMRSYSSVRGDVHASKCGLTLGGICWCRWGCRGATERYDGEREGLLTRQELFFRTQIQRSIVALDTLSCFPGGLRQ